VTAAEGAASPTPNVSFGEFVSANRRRLVDVLSYWWSNHKDVEDAVQEALVLANVQWGDVGVMERPDGWILRVAHRHLCRWSRRDQLHDRITQEAGPNVACAESTPDHGEQLCDRAHLEHALKQLPASQAFAVVAHEAHGFSVNEIAEILALPENTVKTHLRRGRLRLQEILAPSSPKTVQAGGKS
jgi:RNA polymerase sigma-70 factor (ECF subfamily)